MCMLRKVTIAPPLPRSRSASLPLASTCLVSMTGKNTVAEQLLRKTRDQLSDAMKIRRSDHDAYRFHITLAYNLRWFQPDEALQIIALSDQVGQQLVEEIEVIDLGPVEFCSFETMHHFEPLKLL